MAAPVYTVQILDSTLQPITQIQTFGKLDKAQTYLRYGHRLSDVGICQFRIATKDKQYLQYGDIFRPYQNHIRVLRDGQLVWAGVIVNNPHRTAFYIEIEAETYLTLLKKVLIRHDPADGFGGENFRTLKTGTVATAIQTFLTEAKTDVSANSAIAQITIGTLENPNFPTGTTNASGTNIGGQAWTFDSTGQQIKFDWKSAYYCIAALGIYTNCDFELTDTLQFNYKQFLGTRQTDIMFEYGKYGNVYDYDIPLLGKKMANYLVGIGADLDAKILEIDKSDPVSIATYGKLADVAAFADAKNTTTLTARTVQTLSLISTPDSEIHLRLNDRAYPVGQFNIGDIVPVKIVDHFISLQVPRRIVGINVEVSGVGREAVNVITNTPRLNT